MFQTIATKIALCRLGGHSIRRYMYLVSLLLASCSGSESGDNPPPVSAPIPSTTITSTVTPTPTEIIPPTLQSEAVTGRTYLDGPVIGAEMTEIARLVPAQGKHLWQSLKSRPAKVMSDENGHIEFTLQSLDLDDDSFYRLSFSCASCSETGIHWKMLLTGKQLLEGGWQANSLLDLIYQLMAVHAETAYGTTTLRSYLDGIASFLLVDDIDASGLIDFDDVLQWSAEHNLSSLSRQEIYSKNLQGILNGTPGADAAYLATNITMSSYEEALPILRLERAKDTPEVSIFTSEAIRIYDVSNPFQAELKTQINLPGSPGEQQVWYQERNYTIRKKDILSDPDKSPFQSYIATVISLTVGDITSGSYKERGSVDMNVVIPQAYPIVSQCKHYMSVSASEVVPVGYDLWLGYDVNYESRHETTIINIEDPDNPRVVLNVMEFYGGEMDGQSETQGKMDIAQWERISGCEQEDLYERLSGTQQTYADFGTFHIWPYNDKFWRIVNKRVPQQDLLVDKHVGLAKFIRMPEDYVAKSAVNAEERTSSVSVYRVTGQGLIQLTSIDTSELSNSAPVIRFVDRRFLLLSPYGNQLHIYDISNLQQPSKQVLEIEECGEPYCTPSFTHARIIGDTLITVEITEQNQSLLRIRDIKDISRELGRLTLEGRLSSLQHTGQIVLYKGSAGNTGLIDIEDRSRPRVVVLEQEGDAVLEGETLYFVHTPVTGNSHIVVYDLPASLQLRQKQRIELPYRRDRTSSLYVNDRFLFVNVGRRSLVYDRRNSEGLVWFGLMMSSVNYTFDGLSLSGNDVSTGISANQFHIAD